MYIVNNRCKEYLQLRLAEISHSNHSFYILYNYHLSHAFVTHLIIENIQNLHMTLNQKLSNSKEKNTAKYIYINKLWIFMYNKIKIYQLIQCS